MKIPIVIPVRVNVFDPNINQLALSFRVMPAQAQDLSVVLKLE